MGTVWILLMGQGINLITVIAIVIVLGYWNKQARESLKDDLRNTVATMINDIRRHDRENPREERF